MRALQWDYEVRFGRVVIVSSLTQSPACSAPASLLSKHWVVTVPASVRIELTAVHALCVSGEGFVCTIKIHRKRSNMWLSFGISSGFTSQVAIRRSTRTALVALTLTESLTTGLHRSFLAPSAWLGAPFAATTD